MRNKWAARAAVVTLAAGTMLVPATTPAQAAEPATADVISMSKVWLIDGRPVVFGEYSCTGAFSHLWVSAKQGGEGDLSQEGSGAMSRAWWQRTIDNKLTCDGKTHEIAVKLRRTPGFGRLSPEGRKAWVQFCLATANDPEAPEGEQGFDSIMKFKDVARLRV